MPQEPPSLGPPHPPAPAKKQQGLSVPEGPSLEQMNALTGRLRMNEERYGELRKKLLLVEQNMLSHHKKAMSEVRSLQSDLTELKRTLISVEDKIITIIKELQLTARKEDVGVLKRYMEYWDPVKFVTVDQMEKMIDEKFSQKRSVMHEHKPPRYDSPS